MCACYYYPPKPSTAAHNPPLIKQQILSLLEQDPEGAHEEGTYRIKSDAFFDLYRKKHPATYLDFLKTKLMACVPEKNFLQTLLTKRFIADCLRMGQSGEAHDAIHHLVRVLQETRLTRRNKKEIRNAVVANLSFLYHASGPDKAADALCRQINFSKNSKHPASSFLFCLLVRDVLGKQSMKDFRKLLSAQIAALSENKTASPRFVERLKERLRSARPACIQLRARIAVTENKK